MTKTICSGVKINLSLHITGRGQDGYHNLSGITVFSPDIGDEISFAPIKGAGKRGDAAMQDHLHITGPFAEPLQAEAVSNNLIIKALRAVRGIWPDLPYMDITLDKKLPLASGIGGGSCDAAAMIRAIANDYDLNIQDTALRNELLRLGADIPVCLYGRPCLMEGRGEKISGIEGFPAAYIVLLNPLQAVSTPQVFKAYKSQDIAFSNHVTPPQAQADLRDWCDMLAAQRNDLQAPAMSLCPDIRNVLDVMAGLDGAAFSRMCGSGATCFALFEGRDEAVAAWRRLQEECPSYWSVMGRVLALDESS